MGITELQMIKHLGRGLKVFMTDGTESYFKPMALENRKWIGYDDQGVKVTIERDKIEGVELDGR